MKYKEIICLFLILMFCNGCAATSSGESEEPIVSETAIAVETETEETTEVEAEAESKAKTMLNGYNEGKNIKFTFSGLDFSVPSYWKESSQSDEGRVFSIRDTSTKTDADLSILCYNDEDDTVYQGVLNDKDALRNYFMNEALSGISTEEDFTKELKIAGMESQLFTYTLLDENFEEYYTAIDVIFDTINHRGIVIILCESVSSTYDFYDDYLKVIGHIKKSENPVPTTETVLTSELVETTVTSETEVLTDDVSELITETMATTEMLETNEDIEILETETTPTSNEIESQTEVSTESIYDIALKRSVTGYDLYFLFDEDTKHFWNFLSLDDGILEGTYTGDLESGMYLSYDEEDMHESIKRKKGSSTIVIVIDPNGYDWEYKQISVSEAERIFNKFQ